MTSVSAEYEVIVMRLLIWMVAAYTPYSNARRKGGIIVEQYTKA